MSDQQRKSRKRLAVKAAAPMFVISLVFLANVAALIVFWVGLAEAEQVEQAVAAEVASSDNTEQPIAARAVAVEPIAIMLGYLCLGLTGLLWPIFPAEILVYRLLGGARLPAARQHFFVCLCPPLRLGLSHPEMDGRIWLPKLGWSRINEQLRQRLEKVFGLPMIFIALMILPILLVEFGLHEQVNERLWLRVLLHMSTGMIWFAFALEFVIMCSVAERKLRYCKEHWLDVAIILLPFISFLRSLRVVRATRLARLAKVPQLAKMARMYRLRGLAIKAFRAILLFEVLNRLMGVTPERRVRSLKEQLARKELEISTLRRRIEELERVMASATVED